MTLTKSLTGLSTPIIQQLTRTLATGGSAQKFTLPDLPYDYAALEPAITGQIMETHHKKHHNTYVTNLNATYDKLNSARQSDDVTSTLALTSALNFNGGGHVNHSIFWTNLAPAKQGGGEEPSSSDPLGKAIQTYFGGVDKLKQIMTTAGLGVQGSGWAWLGYNSATGALQVVTRANQDPLVDLVPLLGIDVWEHAYYYKYGPARAEYLKNIWSVINWKNVAERYSKAASK